MVCVGELEPLYFVRSGNINVSRGEHSNIGGISYAMSNTTGTYANASTWGANAYFLRIDGWIVKPSSEDVRWLAFPVRCLVYIVKKKKNSLLRP